MKALGLATITVLALAACNRDRVETPEGAQNTTVIDTAPPAPAATDTMATITTTATNTSTGATSDAAPAQTTQIADGQSVYKARCASCHGVDGKKNAANVILASAETQARPDAQLIQMIREQGPHRGLTMSDAEAAAVVSYIKALK